MNRRFYCAVGVASGVLLLGGGVARAAGTADEADRNIDRATSGLPTDIFLPTGQQVTGNANAGVGRTELLPGLGGGGGGPNAVLGLLGGLPGGNLLGQLTGKGSPLGQLLGSGPLGTLLDDPKKAAANDAGPTGPAGGNSPGAHRPAFDGDDDATVWGQTAPSSGNRGVGATATDMADPALGAAVANPTWRVPTLNQPGTRHGDDTAATGGTEEPASGTGNIGDGFEESQSAVGKPLGGGMLNPLSKLGRVQILGGGETMGNLPIVGNLLKDGVSLDTLSNLRGVSDAAQLGKEDAGKSLPLLGNLPSVGNVGRMLLGEESTSRPKESATVDPSLARVAEHRALAQRAIDKAKVTPELVALFDSDTLGVQADSGLIHQLPLAG